MNSPSEHYEQLLAFISTHIPTPFTQEEDDSGVIFTGGSPGEVIVRLTPTAVIIEEYAIHWESPGNPVLRPRRVGTVKWRRLPETELMTIVEQLIKGTRDMRISRYRVCQACGKTTPPEWMIDDEICRGCAERTPLVVH